MEMPGDVNESTTPYGFAVKKGENAELLAMFQAGLANIKANGKYDEIVAKYTKQDGIKISKDGENTEMRVNVKVGEKVFSAILYDNSATKSLISKLPLKMKMNELNGNEKYYNLDYSLPTTSVKPEKINTGDIMLYTSNCLVIFYDTFNTNYSYTKIGYIEDLNGLKEVLGNDSVEVEITLE